MLNIGIYLYNNISSGLSVATKLSDNCYPVSVHKADSYQRGLKGRAYIFSGLFASFFWIFSCLTSLDMKFDILISELSAIGKKQVPATMWNVCPIFISEVAANLDPETIANWEEFSVSIASVLVITLRI